MPKDIPFPRHPKASSPGWLWRDDDGSPVQLVSRLVDRATGRSASAAIAPDGRVVLLVEDREPRSATATSQILHETELFVDEELNVSWRPDNEE
jgi:hypothetical protein